MNKIFGLALGGVVAAVAAPSLAQAQNAYTTEYVNLRAGPGLEYPIVFAVQPGQPIDSNGCLSDWSWCDVSVDGYRGWMAGEFISYAYGGSYVPLYTYGPRYGVPIISFNFVTYWDRWYRDRPWYHDRDYWAHYDWRGRRWDDDRWRRWADDHRHDYDRDHRWGWNGRDNDHRGGWDNRRDGDRHDGDRRDGNWNRTDNNRGNDHQWNGNWNGRSNVRTDNDRRPGAPVQGRSWPNGHSNDPSVHSGANAQTNNQPNHIVPNRGNSNWNGGNRPDNRQFKTVKPDTDHGNRNATVNRQVTPPKNQHVDRPRDNGRNVQRNVQDNRQNNGGGKGRGGHDRDNDS